MCLNLLSLKQVLRMKACCPVVSGEETLEMARKGFPALAAPPALLLVVPRTSLIVLACGQKGPQRAEASGCGICSLSPGGRIPGGTRPLAGQSLRLGMTEELVHLGPCFFPRGS